MENLESLKDKSFYELIRLAKTSNDPDTLRALSKVLPDDETVYMKLLENDYTPGDVLVDFLDNPLGDNYIKVKAYEHPNFPESVKRDIDLAKSAHDPKVLNDLSESPIGYIREMLSKNSHLPSTALKNILKRENSLVALRLASSPTLRKKDLLEILGNPQDYMLPKALPGIANNSNSDLEVIKKAYEVYKFIRMESPDKFRFLYELTSNKHTPPNILEEVAFANTDNDLILDSVARNENINIKTINLLLESGDSTLIHRLVRNNVNIPESELNHLVLGNHQDLAEAALNHPNASVKTRRLFQRRMYKPKIKEILETEDLPKLDWASEFGKDTKHKNHPDLELLKRLKGHLKDYA